MEQLRTFYQRWSFIFAMAFISLFTTACNDDTDEMVDTDTTEETVEIFSSSDAADDAAEMEIALSFMAQDEVAASTSGRNNNRFRACATITRDSVNRTMVIDFGSVGCEGPDGRIRRGKIIIDFGGDMGERIAQRTISFDEYFVDRRQYMGQIEVNSMRQTSEGFLVSVRVMRDFTLVYADGNRVVTNGEMTREWIEGMGDGDPKTNIIRLTGNKTGQSAKGRAFREEIIEPIILDFGCLEAGGLLRVAGIIEMTLGNLPSQSNAPRIVRRIDYGDGTCNNEVTVTISGRPNRMQWGD